MITEIERFIATVDRGSFTKASQILFLTQPALSLSIAILEKEIGVKLFKRIGKHLVLTKDGILLIVVHKNLLLTLHIFL